MKAVVAAFKQEKALVGAFSVITNLRMELFEALAATPRQAVADNLHGGKHSQFPLLALCHAILHEVDNLICKMWGQFLWRDDDSNDEVKMQNGWFDYCIFSDTLSLLVAEGNAWMICVYSIFIFTLKQCAWVQSLHSIRCCCCHLAEYADLDYAQFEPYCAGSSLDCEVNFGNHWQYCKLVNVPSNPFKILKQTILIYPHKQIYLKTFTEENLIKPWEDNMFGY